MIHTIIVSGYEKDELTFKAACVLKQAESVLLHTEKCDPEGARTLDLQRDRLAL